MLCANIACAQDFEFDGIPEAWVVPMNEVVDELWIPSQYNRDIFVGDGVNGSKVTVPFLKVFMPSLMPSLGRDANMRTASYLHASCLSISF